MNESKVYTVDDIALECEVKKDSIIRFLTYCKQTKAYDIPLGKRGLKNRYEFTKDEKNTIVNIYKNKKHGEMAEFNKSYWWGKSYRQRRDKK